MPRTAGAPSPHGSPATTVMDRRGTRCRSTVSGGFGFRNIRWMSPWNARKPAIAHVPSNHPSVKRYHSATAKTSERHDQREQASDGLAEPAGLRTWLRLGAGRAHDACPGRRLGDVSSAADDQVQRRRQEDGLVELDEEAPDLERRDPVARERRVADEDHGLQDRHGDPQDRRAEEHQEQGGERRRSPP